jgi:hypothetical protein
MMLGCHGVEGLQFSDDLPFISTGEQIATAVRMTAATVAVAPGWYFN